MNSTIQAFYQDQNHQLVSNTSHLPLWQTSDWRAWRSGPNKGDFKIPSLKVLHKRAFHYIVNICCELLSLAAALGSHEWPCLAVAPSMVKRPDPIWQDCSGKRPAWQLGSSQRLQMAPESPFCRGPAQYSPWTEAPSSPACSCTCGWGGSGSGGESISLQGLCKSKKD